MSQKKIKKKEPKQAKSDDGLDSDNGNQCNVATLAIDIGVKKKIKNTQAH